MLQPIERVEYDIVDHCNLNCKNCGHISQFKPKGEKSVSLIEEEMNLLTEKFKVANFRITGGEPLLHTNIVGVLMTLRKCFGKETRITLVTNGIKLYGMNDAFYIAVKIADIYISISQYNIKTDYERIKEKLKSKEIPFDIDDRPVFYDFMDPTGSQDGAESFRQCRKFFCCPFYDNKKFHLCAYVANVPFANQHFGYKIEYNCVSIEDDVEKIMDYLYKPCSTCRFCNATRNPLMWQRENEKV